MPNEREIKDFSQKLKALISGEVRDDPVIRKIYSVDASLFEIEPLSIAIPRNTKDLIVILQAAKEYGISITPRGAGTGIAGGCIGRGIVIDFSKYMNRILEVDWENKRVVCEPGVVQDQLNQVLAVKGYRLGPDTSTGNRATLGGMVANNSAGARSLKYGPMAQAVLEVEILLENGEFCRFSSVGREEFNRKCARLNREGDIYRAVQAIRDHYREEIEARFPRLPRRVSGYNLDELIKKEQLNLSKLMAGSEGTLGVITEMTLQIVPMPKYMGLCLIHFDEMITGMEAIGEMLRFNPVSVEMIDHTIIEMARQAPGVRHKMEWLSGNPQAVFAIEIESQSEADLRKELSRIQNHFQQKKIGSSHTVITDSQKMAHIWEVRKAGLGLLMAKRSYTRAVAFIEDISVAPENLSDLMKEYLSYTKAIGKESGIYGHAGAGCMHIRPYINLRNQADLNRMEEIQANAAKMLIKYGGALSGEHGDGLARSWLNERMFGEKIYQAFLEIKQAFDPENRMNPGKIVFPEPFSANRRMDAATPVSEIETFQDFSKEGGFSLSADMCNGNGQCRKKEGVMCPSFQVSNDEYDTTRARAQAFRAIVTGRLPKDEFSGEGLKDVLDLCIQCKGCKTECPSQVDMAKMKAEFLYHYHQRHGYGLWERLFGFIGMINQLSSPFSGLVNWALKSGAGKSFLGAIGISSKRELPSLAKMRFTKWAKDHARGKGGSRVVLFADTFTEFNLPEIGKAAMKILELLGYSVIIPKWQCCGRTLISKGFLRQAKAYASSLVDTLAGFAGKGIPIVGLEPSCIFTIKDDYQGLLGYENKLLQKILPNCFSFDEFIVRHLERGSLPFAPIEQDILLHGHCHQKALAGMGNIKKILKAATGKDIAEIPSGCCGMAGSFGYEEEHYDFSVKIANLKLIPALHHISEKTIIVADGFSCRHQIEHLTGRKPLHLAEALLL